MTKEIRLRKVPDELFVQLEMMSEKFQYPNLADFLMSQLYRIVENDGLDLYDNKLYVCSLGGMQNFGSTSQK